MALTPAQRKANDKYIKEHYTQVKLSMPNEEAEQLDQFCTKYGYTKAGFIRQAIKEKMDQINRPLILDEKQTAVLNGVEHDVLYQRRIDPRFDFPWNHTDVEDKQHE